MSSWRSPLVWNSEGIGCELFRREVEEIVGVQVEHQPHANHDGKGDKTGLVVDRSEEKRQQKDPENGVVSDPDQRQWMGVPLLDGHEVVFIVPEPREPRSGMNLDAYSVNRPHNRQYDQPTLFRPDRCGKRVNHKEQRGNSQRDRENIVPTHGQEFFLGHSTSPFVYAQMIPNTAILSKSGKAAMFCRIEFREL